MYSFQPKVQDERWISHWLHLVVPFFFYVTEKPAWWIYVAFQICSELRCRAAHPFSSGCTGSPGMRVSVYLPLSPPLRYVSLRLWYNICHISSELKLDVRKFLLFHFRRHVSLVHKSEGDYTKWNINKNSSLPLLPYLWWVFASRQTS